MPVCRSDSTATAFFFPGSGTGQEVDAYPIDDKDLARIQYDPDGQPIIFCKLCQPPTQINIRNKTKSNVIKCPKCNEATVSENLTMNRKYTTAT